ncbi:tRNA (uridine(34)/cytosine(34)/5-carboxymethylaminomethyluridine(34)-2'-O)-methyltransferase TrmL [[Mycoplasma] testudinis]|uniref:tRNA (uridine(34)/cytosine(34)/5- carboxymethylaminomethyluridine(34)-2'-O)- methyltransferase TrmL n=1 Tax=[Mycoplasma] testudinis TaxID=33924 RepID=UPI00069731F2|nr:tRNA (uridine(34)/cytosine(34)/5-carboxymethylaminomethyluridine(34)-2'-O)-methyltransferase TrmL [[Mycoplasma] testudinis]
MENNFTHTQTPKPKKLNIVLYQPEIPYNTGNIARSCVAFNARLHLIRPYGFFLNDKRMVRAAVDYWQQAELQEHDNFDAFLKIVNQNDQIFFLTKSGKHNPHQIDFQIKNDHEIYLVFGQETKGLPANILEKYNDKTLRIPVAKELRSLNLSNSVVLLMYEVWRQNNFKDLVL